MIKLLKNVETDEKQTQVKKFQPTNFPFKAIQMNHKIIDKPAAYFMNHTAWNYEELCQVLGSFCFITFSWAEHTLGT